MPTSLPPRAFAFRCPWRLEALLARHLEAVQAGFPLAYRVIRLCLAHLS